MSKMHALLATSKIVTQRYLDKVSTKVALLFILYTFYRYPQDTRCIQDAPVQKVGPTLK